MSCIHTAIFALCGLLMLSGCLPYANWKLTLAERDLVEERAAIVKLYRQCLERYPSPDAKAQCEHYTQALYSIDVHSRQ